MHKTGALFCITKICLEVDNYCQRISFARNFENYIFGFKILRPDIQSFVS